MPQKLVSLDGIGTVALYKRRGMQSMRISIRPDGTIRVTLPIFVSYQAALQFVLSKRDWLAEHRLEPSAPLENAQAVGKSYRLLFIANFTALKPTSRLTANTIIVNYPSSFSMEEPSVQKAAEAGAVRALRQEAEDTLPNRVAQVAQKAGFQYKSVIIKKLKGRWGSCDQDNNIVLNLYLMQLPWQLIDYVILHELVHTKHLHHGESFWSEFVHHEPAAKLLRKSIHNYQPNVVLPPAQ